MLVAATVSVAASEAIINTAGVMEDHVLPWLAQPSSALSELALSQIVIDNWHYESWGKDCHTLTTLYFQPCLRFQWMNQRFWKKENGTGQRIIKLQHLCNHSPIPSLDQSPCPFPSFPAAAWGWFLSFPPSVKPLQLCVNLRYVLHMTSKHTCSLFGQRSEKCQQWGQPTPTASLVTHSCKSWSICCVRQLLALHSPPGRSMLTPVSILHQCGGMTFGHTEAYVTDRGCTPRDRAMWTCFCAGVSDNREFQRAFVGEYRFLNMPVYLIGSGEGEKWILLKSFFFILFYFTFSGCNGSDLRPPVAGVWICKVSFFWFFWFFCVFICQWMYEWYEWYEWLLCSSTN